MSKLNYINLGCGHHFHPDWINIDFFSASPAVKAHNLLDGIPFQDNKADVVYHSHVLEHFPKDKAADFVRECYRVLRPGGIIRIAIPDLEQIVAHYKRITNSLTENPDNERLWADYDWIMLEMYDQTVRRFSGGDMGKYLTSGNLVNRDFVIQRCGEEVRGIIDGPDNYSSFGKKEAGKTSLLKEIYRLVRYGDRKERLARLVLGQDYNILLHGRFRTSGEVHQWMYDRFSLSRLLRKNGFENFAIKTAFESDIPNWTSFNLDGKDGKVRKPDSLFVEARKPLH